MPDDVGTYATTEPPKPAAIPVPDPVQRCITRGRAEMKRNANRRRLCVRFERGDTFHYLDHKGQLQATALATNPRGGGKPPHRIRNRYNFIRPIVEDKVSSATQRVPAFELDPSTTDPEDAAAAKLAERVAIYGYDAWRYRGAVVDVVKTAIGLGGRGFALPYFKRDVGPYTLVDGQWVGQGDVRIKTFGGNEVYWEAGVDFDESPWWCTEEAQTLDEIRNTPGFIGCKLAADASTSDIPNDRGADTDLVMVTNYYERPCPRWPNGRWLTIAGGRVIVDNRLINPASQLPWQDYPLQDADGTVIDEPLIHRLVYTHDPEDDDDLGLTWQLLDFQRSAQDCLNKMMEFKNRGLNLQMLAPVNSLIDRPDDVHGAVRHYRPGPNGEKPEWERSPDPQILSNLVQIFNLILEAMKDVASYEDVHADPNVAARTVQAAIGQSIARWQSFLGDLAEFHSRLMRHCLLLVARFYTEPRTLEIRGRMGWEPIRDFRGAKLLGQANVRVFPGSLEYLTKQQIMAKVQYYASMGWISGQQAMAAIENGQAEKITESYDLDVAKVNRIIQKIRDGTVMDMPARTELVDGPVDPATGQAQKIQQDVPTWMPSEFDNLTVWQDTLANWMKTEDFEQAPDAAQEVARLMWAGLQDLKAKKAQQDAAQQQAMAQSLGMGNAAKPQGPPAPPSLPSMAAAGDGGPPPAPDGS